MKVRYRERSAGVTRKSLKAGEANLYKVGMVKEVLGYRVNGNEYVMVKGTKGSARFGGYCWSYCGEGPRGLAKLLNACGWRPAIADHMVWNFERKSVDGIDWVIKYPVPIPIDASPLVTD